MRGIFFVLAAFAAITHVNAIDGMYCGDGDGSNPIDKIANTCTPLVYGERTYCCFNFHKQSKYCCDAMEFATNGAGILVAIIGVIAVVMVLICCVSCLCCTCCPWYRRRHRGTVYGQVQGPRLVQVIQPPGNVAQLPYAQPKHTAYAYPANQAAMPYSPAQSSSHYATEAYSKQAPYNPNYAH